MNDPSNSTRRHSSTPQHEFSGPGRSIDLLHASICFMLQIRLESSAPTVPDSDFRPPLALALSLHPRASESESRPLTDSEWGRGAMAVSRRPIPAPGGIRPVGRRDPGAGKRAPAGSPAGHPRSLLGARFPGGARAIHTARPSAGVVQLKLD